MECFYLVFVIILFLNVFGLENPCKTLDHQYQHYLGTKTPYRVVSELHDTPMNYPGCEPTRIWALVRHGTRNPGHKFINKVNTRLSHLRDLIVNNHETQLCKQDIDIFKHWIHSADIAKDKFLVHEGEDEMLELAERLQNRFPTLLIDKYSNKTYNFRLTATQRTEKSKYYFTIGLFGRKVAGHVWSPQPLHKDPVLRFYKLCSKWRKDVKKNPDALYERDQFDGAAEMRQLVADVGNVTGLKDKITFDDIKLMYKTCGFETAWHRNQQSPWCSVFSRSNLEVLEYSEDLNYYWIDGYGYDINYQQACPMMGDMIQHLTSDNANIPDKTFYFTHSGTLLKFLSHLGLYKDKQVLRHNNRDEDRLWRVGRIDAFGSNIAFILFICGDESKILTLHQEKPVKLPGCPDEGLCPLETILDTYQDSIQSCRFDDLCQN